MEMEELKAFQGELTCPKCSNKFAVSLYDFDNDPNNIVKCPSCQYGLLLSQNDIDEIKKRIQELKDSFKSINK